MKERNRKIRTPGRIQIHELMNIGLEFCCCAETTALLLSNEFPHSKTTEQSCLGRILSGMKQKFFRSLSLSLSRTQFFVKVFFIFLILGLPFNFKARTRPLVGLLLRFCQNFATETDLLSLSSSLSLSSTCPHSHSRTRTLSLSPREKEGVSVFIVVTR